MEFSLLVGQGNGCARKLYSTSAQKYKKLRQPSQQNMSRKKSRRSDQVAGKKCALKINAKDSEKNVSKVSARKLKLADAEIGSLTTSSSASKNLSPLKKEECFQVSNKKKGKYLRKKLVSETSDDIKCQSVGKMREIVEIEVFMPYVDVENNTIVYPLGCEKPILKRYFVKENSGFKSKKNMRSNEKNKENTVKKYLRSKMEKDLDGNLNKNTPKPGRKSNEANFIKSALMERKSSDMDLQLWNLEDLEEEIGDGDKIQNLEEKVVKETKILPGSELECMKSSSVELENPDNSNSSTLPSKNKKKNYITKQNSKNIHKLIHQSTAKLPMDVTNGKKNSVCSISNEESSDIDLQLWNLEDSEEEIGDGDKIQNLEEKFAKETKILSGSELECIKSASVELENAENSNSSTLSSKNKKKNYNTKQNSKNIHDLIHQSTAKLPMGVTNGKKNSVCSIANEECARKKDEATKERNQNIKSRISKTTNLLSSPAYASTEETKPYKLINLNEVFHGSEKSNASNYQVSNDIKQNGRKRMNRGNSSRRFSGPDKWRKKIEDKCLTMEIWIDRCKYMQARNQSFQKPHDRNPWRRTS